MRADKRMRESVGDARPPTRSSLICRYAADATSFATARWPRTRAHVRNALQGNIRVHARVRPATVGRYGGGMTDLIQCNNEGEMWLKAEGLVGDHRREAGTNLPLV